MPFAVYDGLSPNAEEKGEGRAGGRRPFRELLPQLGQEVGDGVGGEDTRALGNVGGRSSRRGWWWQVWGMRKGNKRNPK